MPIVIKHGMTIYVNEFDNKISVCISCRNNNHFTICSRKHIVFSSRTFHFNIGKRQRAKSNIIMQQNDEIKQ